MSGDIEKIVDEMAEEASESVTSPVSGLSEALGAGASFLSAATHWRAMRLRRHGLSDIFDPVATISVLVSAIASS